MLKLQIEKRTGDAADVRKAGNIPAVFYGPKEASTPISVVEGEFMKAWREAGESTIVTLTGLGEDHDSLIHDVELDPVTDKVRHIDFYIVEKGKKVQVSVPLEFVGEAAAVKTLGGILIKVLHELEIEALPKDLPHAIEVDITPLADFEAQIKVSDLKFPAGITAITDAEEVVALVQEAKEEVEEAPTAIDMDSIGVSVEKGKKEEEEIPAE